MIDVNLLIPAAQYLRISTEHQRYSLENQSTAIQKYAEAHGLQVIQTYSAAAKSGVVLRYRAGLRQLLEDVVGGRAPYKAILVYDVSRWGRFQDTDESAHYEFLCKSEGVPFANLAYMIVTHTDRRLRGTGRQTIHLLRTVPRLLHLVQKRNHPLGQPSRPLDTTNPPV